MTPEKIAYWFFRLNGCFTFENFIVHPDRRGSQRTDADLIAVRLQHRRELYTAGNLMPDHTLFAAQTKLISAFFMEAKTGECALNGPWTDPGKENLQRVLYAMGFLPHQQVHEAAKQLYQRRCYCDDLMTIQFVAVGRQRSQRGAVAEAEQMTWEELLRWIHQRFRDYADQKAHHPQWDGSGRRLYRSAVHDFRHNAEGFVAHWLLEIQVAAL